MNIKEYAESVNLSVAEILKKCETLGIEVKNNWLEENDFIALDIAISLISTEDEATIEDQEDIDEVVDGIVEKSNMTIMNEHTKKQKLKKKSEIQNSKEEFMHRRKEMYKNKEKLQSNKTADNIVLYHEGMTVDELANELNISGTDIIKKLMGLGMMVTLNQEIDYENAEIVVLDYNKILKRKETQNIADFESLEISDNLEDLVARPAVVTIMGHVDHGKTSLLDYIRKSSVTSSEFGGITQHIGAYQVGNENKKITFIDTPGHAAFTAMRARGAKVTDLVIIIVAANDGVMPQTKEAIDHALNANVPIIVAINKIDLPEANIERIMQEMTEIGITPEEWGGNYPFVKISAHTGEGIDLLLETIQTISEVNEYKANPNRYAIGTVIESKVDKNIGGISSLLIQNGTLRLGDPIVVGAFSGKIRTMKNDRGENIVEAKPSTPVEVTGISGTPSAGDKFMAFETEAEAKHIASERYNILKQQKNKKEIVSLEELFEKIKSGQKEINVVLKTDVKGSEEAVRNALEKIEVESVKVKVIRSGVGTITESDVVLANASNALIIGFNVRPSNSTKEIAKEYSVDIRLYTIIYKAVEEMEAAMKGMLDPEYQEKILGTAEIRKIFKFSKVGNIAGCSVTAGLIKNNTNVRVIRDEIVIHDGKIANLQREKDTVKEVKKGFECGITLENFNDIKEKDILENYEMEVVKR